MTQKKLIIVLTGCLLSVTLLVVTLYALSDKIVHQPGSFFREYMKAAAIMSNDLDVGVNTWYIAGITDEHIYFGNITSSYRILVTNLSLTDSQQVIISLKGMEDKLMTRLGRVKVEPPYFYYTDGVLPGLFRGKIGEWEAVRYMFDSAYFDQAELIGPTSFAIRTSNLASESVLGKEQNVAPYLLLDPNLIKKQIDGIFCADGMLQYSKLLNRLIYTYYYRNEFIVYDTNLNLDYRGHTIDTFSIAQIKRAYVSSTKTHVLTSAKLINSESRVCGNYLFIRSNLLAKNDIKRMLEINDIIDVYDLRNNKYKFSFTLPHYDPENMLREFWVYNNRILIGLYGKYIVKFDLQPSYFRDH
jgi:hypothetical protein